MTDFPKDVFTWLFDPKLARMISGDNIFAQRKVIATDPTEKFATRKRLLGSKNLRIRWDEMTNRPMMDMVGCIETPLLVLNENFPNVFLERYFDCLIEPGEGMAFLLSESNRPVVSREIISRSLIGDEFDQKVIDKANRVPLDPALRSILVTLGADVVREYLISPPDALDRGRINADVAEAIFQTMMNEEKFGNKKLAREVEKFIFDIHRDKFPKKILEKFSASKIDTTRGRVACLPGVSQRVEKNLAKDSNNAVLKRVVECTDKCDVIDEVLNNVNITDITEDLAKKKRDDLGC